MKELKFLITPAIIILVVVCLLTMGTVSLSPKAINNHEGYELADYSAGGLAPYLDFAPENALGGEWGLIALKNFAVTHGEYGYYSASICISMLFDHDDKENNYYNIIYKQFSGPNYDDKRCRVSDIYIYGDYASDNIEIVSCQALSSGYYDVYMKSDSGRKKLDLWNDVDETFLAGAYGLDSSVTVKIPKGAIYVHADTHETQYCKKTSKLFGAFYNYSDYTKFSIDYEISIDDDVVTGLLKTNNKDTVIAWE